MGLADSIEWHDRAWQGELLARIYEPPAATRAERSGAAVVDVHGGAWSSRDRTLGERYCLAVAAAGFVVIAIDFRDGRVARHPAAVQDIADAVRWVRGEGIALGVDPERVALIGSSSGGHLALHVALTEVDVPFVAAFWPPTDPLSRYLYAKGLVGAPVPAGQSFDAPGLVASTEAYFGEEAVMREASIAGLVRAGRARYLPPVWLARAGEDMNVPASMIDELALQYRKAGGALELTEYPGEVHGFGHGGHAGAIQFQADLIERLVVALQ